MRAMAARMAPPNPDDARLVGQAILDATLDIPQANLCGLDMVG